ncbi:MULTISPECIES: efflux RND transporter periplasmic adaptor subunit [Alteromonas]|jgi:membrane fusion protein (multidrug efflux system)|uniref:Efflux RND transporter periplasmic adaptor subunit n=1 Tax=Alteromonas stellipolaris TaxID=233316 RepID=A0AAW7YX75_9ALTE|nr:MULTISPECIES: efflux RND transporter periplasmic adaptor subunit [Alteromonas]AMJ90092.1 efflux transporter periplasmic adaptor subunit [Alteromonas sp. Mac2]ALM90747.1 Co/Zn/Cd efflux system membrane fusion protein [Alteromonas stellipolaris LMG 21856]AMJ73804.1 efflux transporter periplasmic adaptor subunit [Alteromonas stellipolaris]AMJ86234.1 efflux transporter periplasmic adaptor subunit [Alteromonas sp. Mac1]AMJ93937.1 efflux transporter periplasmic adaptor subunit [Alteromonas stelli
MDASFNTLRTLSLTGGILSLSLLLGACTDADAINPTEEISEAVIAIPVEAAAVTNGSISSTYTTTAILEAREEAFVVARASGIIEQIVVEEGDYVEKGQILAQLDKRRYELNLAKAKADLTGLERELDKVNKVYSKNLISVDTYDKLTAQYESAQASVHLAELDLKETTITAPISGFIASRNAKVGNLTESFQRERMFHIVQQQNLQGVVYLPENELQNVAVGQPATLIVAALGNKSLTASVERISPVIDAATGTFKVTLAVPNEKHVLKAGMFTDVALEYALHNSATLLPRRALITMDNQHSVFVVKDNIATKVDIVTGFEQDEMIEVLSGLQGDEKVVTAGHQNLKDQAPVDVVNG